MDTTPDYRPVPIRFATSHPTETDSRPCPITLRTPPQRWAYGSLSSELDLVPDEDGFVIIKVTVVVGAGPVGISLVAATDVSRMIGERILDASPDVQEVIFAATVQERWLICVRTGDADTAGEATVHSVDSTCSPKLVKEFKAAAFPHWYYTTDLGDGVLVRATVADEPSWTRSNAVARAIFTHLVETFIGSIQGSRVLDVACSAGHFSCLFARMGAEVHGFDHDPKAIEQALLIAKYVGQDWSGSAEFSVSNLEEFSAPQPFDVVFCSGLFYHLRDPLGGAQKLHRLCERWLVLQSCVSDREDQVFELSDTARWPFCASWEFALVPSASMVRAVFESVGFRVHAAFRLGDFIFHPDTETVEVQNGAGSHDRVHHGLDRIGDPIYLVMEKT